MLLFLGFSAFHSETHIKELTKQDRGSNHRGGNYPNYAVLAINGKVTTFQKSVIYYIIKISQCNMLLSILSLHHYEKHYSL